MRLIDADKLYPDRLTKTGELAISQSQIAEAPTVESEKVCVGKVTFNKDELEEIVQTRVIDKIKSGELVIKKAGEWIPVSERLPEEDGQYLITVKYKPEADYENIYAEHGEWNDGKWDMFCFGHCGEIEDIIAWMPLPEPYKETEND